MKETVQQTKQRYALYGAQYKVDALQQEIDKIKKAFPSLSASVILPTATVTKAFLDTAPRKVRTWTKAQKAEASKRAKAFWAKRRKG